MSEDFLAALNENYDKMAASGEESDTENTSEAVTDSAEVEQISESDHAQPAEAQTQEVISSEPLNAPPEWSESAKQAFAKAPREVQEQLLERSKEMQADYTRKTQETAKLRKHYEAVDQVIAPHAEYLARQGKSPAEAVDALMRAQIALDKDPASVILHLAQERGLNLAQLAQIQSQSSAQVSHPAIQQLSTELAKVQQQLAQQQDAEVLNESLLTIQEFAGEKDANGNPLRPHFEEVRPYLSGIISELRSSDDVSSDREILELAYAEAVKPLKALEAKLMQERKQKVEAAKKAGVSVTSSPGGGVTSQAPKNMREALEQTYDQLARR